MHIVVMGVSGCGKSTLGVALAQALGISYVEGDELHPAANVQKMSAGHALTDADRQGWLERIAARLAQAVRAGQGVVVSCSALKRSYRDLLRAGAPDLQLVHLHGSTLVLEERMRHRPGHYMPASLLQSQLDTLQMPGTDEAVLTVDIAQPIAQQLAQALAHFRKENA
ncbi:MAG: gluconokinase [Pseudomonadota bacterium]|nr:gluconokinase [Pseudomonadota bacterium]